MAEDDNVELLWKRGQVLRSSQTQTPPSGPPPILRGSGSGAGGSEEGDAPLLLQPFQQNLFIQEDEMASWLHHPPGQDYFRSEILYSGPATQPPPSSISPAPPPAQQPPPDTSYCHIVAGRRAENFMNFLRLRENILTGGRVEAGPLIPVVRETLQVGSSATPATESCVIPGRVSSTFIVPGLSRKTKAVAIAGTPSSEVSKVETELIQIQPATETEPADDRKQKEREETIVEIQETEEARGSTSRKRSRAAEMHNLSERRRREKINEKMKTLQELIPRCNKTDKASMLDDAIEYVKWLQNQLQMMSTETGMMPMMYPGNMQPFMPQMPMGMMGINRPPFIPFPVTPFPRRPHMADVGSSYPAPSYPFPIHPSRVHLPSSHPNPVSSQPQFQAYMNPYSQFPVRPQMQQTPPLMLTQTTSELSFSHASSSKEPKDQGNQPKDSGT